LNYEKNHCYDIYNLDGVLLPHGPPKEDTSGGFNFGGWSAPFRDEVTGQVMKAQMEPTDLLIGLKTFGIFADYWPKHADNWPGL
jgi:hypothetical protein